MQQNLFLIITEIWNPDIYQPPLQTKCVDQVTKLSEEVVKWIKEVDEGNYDIGKSKQVLTM